MTIEEAKKEYNKVMMMWQFMKTFLLRDAEADPDQYWQDLVDQSYHGHDEFTARIFAAAIIEIKRIKG